MRRRKGKKEESERRRSKVALEQGWRGRRCRREKGKKGRVREREEEEEGYRGKTKRKYIAGDETTGREEEWERRQRAREGGAR